jgi:hypothetical protein
VVVNLKVDGDGVAVPQIPPQRMPPRLVDEAIDALKTAAEEFHSCGGRHLTGLVPVEIFLEGWARYIPGYHDFCKLFHIQCMVSPIG